MKKNSFFWISYSDLMTSLFFIVLVLFVMAVRYVNIQEVTIGTLRITIDSLKNTINKIEVTETQYKTIEKIENQFKSLSVNDVFTYLPECNKFVVKNLTGKEIFDSNQADIKSQFKDDVIRAGKEIAKFLNTLQAEHPDLSYLLIIEGNTANEQLSAGGYKWDSDFKGSYELSYKRALTLYSTWVDAKIDFRKNNVEVLICGSGMNGICRDHNEIYNKRFSIQIIPKMPKIENQK